MSDKPVERIIREDPDLGHTYRAFDLLSTGDEISRNLKVLLKATQHVSGYKLSQQQVAQLQRTIHSLTELSKDLYESNQALCDEVERLREQ